MAFFIPSYFASQSTLRSNRVLDARYWERWFEKNRDKMAPIPWECAYRIGATEKALLTASIQEFERGENARGRSFRIRGRLYAMRQRDSRYPRALQLFIWEEQRHSAYLRRYMELEGIPRQEELWVDNVFRRLRKLAGLDCMIMVLVSAEIIAMSYYRALSQATSSPILKAICRRILKDEVAHLQFQGGTLAKLRRSLHPCHRFALEIIHFTLLIGTSLVVWQHHRAVYAAAGISFRMFMEITYREFRRTIRYSRTDSAASSTHFSRRMHAQP